MAKTMTASGPKTITNGQNENVADKLRATMRKHRSEVASDMAQKVLGVENLGMELYAVVRKHAERFSNMLSRIVAVDRSRSPQAALDATGRRQYTDRAVVDAMPRGDGTEVEIFFFKPGCFLSDADLEKEFDLRGLKPADPYSLAAVNEKDPAFADAHPNATHWKDAAGRWCFATFYRWRDGRLVGVDRGDHDWHDRWWFAGVRK